MTLDEFDIELKTTLGKFPFETEYESRRAAYFLGKSDLLFAIAVDYPKFYKIPLYLREAVQSELKRLGFRVDRSSLKQVNSVPTYRLFYLGPRRNRGAYGYRPSSTRKEDATSFKIYFYNLSSYFDKE
jgi:hypothetical protein